MVMLCSVEKSVITDPLIQVSKLTKPLLKLYYRSSRYVY